jgi:2-polyprenyl-3-methyl-5-hydroxy-6-metoxy-1,4-benzoquinol methylase
LRNEGAFNGRTTERGGFSGDTGEGVVSFFDQSYEGVPPWDIGRPQQEFVGLAEEGQITGTVLDVGCGTGEHVLHLASRGFEVWGIDTSPRAIEKAKTKSAQRGLVATFLLFDALEIEKLGRTFDTVIDSGLFHSLSDDERARFVTGLRKVLKPGGRYFMLCFSEKEPGSEGPRRVTQAEIRAAFQEGWSVDYTREATFESNRHPNGARAWLAAITRM